MRAQEEKRCSEFAKMLKLIAANSPIIKSFHDFDYRDKNNNVILAENDYNNLFEALKNNDNVTELRFEEQMPATLPNFISTNSTIRELAIQVHAKNENIRPLLEELKYNSSLEDFQLKCESMTKEQSNSLCELLKSNQSIKSLSITDSDIRSTASMFTSIFDSLQSNKKVKRFFFSREHDERDAQTNLKEAKILMTALSELLSVNQTISNLSINFTCSNAAIEQFMAVIKEKNFGLQSLTGLNGRLAKNFKPKKLSPPTIQTQINNTEKTRENEKPAASAAIKRFNSVIEEKNRGRQSIEDLDERPEKQKSIPVPITAKPAEPVTIPPIIKTNDNTAPIKQANISNSDNIIISAINNDNEELPKKILASEIPKLRSKFAAKVEKIRFNSPDICLFADSSYRGNEKLTENDFNNLFEALKNNNNLKKLSFDQIPAALPKFIQTNSTIRELSLILHYDNVNFIPLMEKLENNNTIEILSLQCDSMTSEQNNSLCQCLTINRSIISLNIAHHDDDKLTKPSTNLPTMGMIKLLFDALKSNKTVTDFVFSRHTTLDQGNILLKSLSQLLSVNQTIENLTFNFNCSDAAIKQFMAVIKDKNLGLQSIEGLNGRLDKQNLHSQRSSALITQTQNEDEKTRGEKVLAKEKQVSVLNAKLPVNSDTKKPETAETMPKPINAPMPEKPAATITAPSIIINNNATQIT